MGKGIYIGIDVGTGSARAGVFDDRGKMLAAATEPIKMWRPRTDFVEQSSDDIWRAVCKVVREARKQTKVEASRVRGIGFDATCSLVLLDAKDKPVTASPTGRDEQNIIVWMDHRALEQTQRINAMGHSVLQFVGGRLSPEMESPKLLWLKENLPKSWKRSTRFFDLPDFLVYRATGSDTRSLCSTVCKWTFLGHEKSTNKASVGRWDASYWKKIGLGELVDDGYTRIGQTVRPMGEPAGEGLSKIAAKELGLNAGTPVGVSIIDAHAGGLGMLGAKLDGKSFSAKESDKRIALIGGTSSCHMAVSPSQRMIPGVWGPYFSAMVPGMWLNEGGQSATGSLVDHTIFSHARAADLQSESKKTGQSIYEILNARVDDLAKKSRQPAAMLTRELHVLPYFHGNRSPRADATLRGAISGLKLSDTIDDLALLYLATIQAIAHGTKHIIDSMNARGYKIDTIFACGGGTKNPVFIREHADISGCRVVLPAEPEAVLLGSAVLGAVASTDFKSVADAMSAMNRADKIIAPARGEVAKYHATKHAVFLKMYEDQMSYRKWMDGGNV